MKIKTILFLILFILIFSFVSNNYLTEPDDFPAIIFVYDDGHREDIEKALPIHQKYDVPAVSAVNPSTIGNSRSLTKNDLLRLESSGWEIASHGKKHAALIYNSIKEDIERGDQKIKLNNSNLIEKNYSYYLYNTDKHYGERIKFSNKVTENGSNYYNISEEIKNPYPKENGYIMLTENSMKKEIIDSKIELQEMGLTITTFVYPYNGFNEPAKNIVSEHYDFARGGRRLNQDFPECFINQIPLSVHRLKGVSFENNFLKREDLDQLLREAAGEKALLIFYAHTGNQDFSTTRLEYIIETAQKLNYNITTFQELAGR